jgi:hypothetical protein
MWPTPDGELTAYQPFSIDGAQRRDLNLGSTEPPNLEGIAKQQMRHNEILMKIVTQSSLQQMEWSDRMIREQRERIKELEAGRFKTLEVAEQLLNAQADRDTARRREEAAEARRALATKEFFDLFPIVKAKLIQGLTGHKLLEAKSAEVMALKTMFKGLTPEALQTLLSGMPPTDAAITLQLYCSTMGVDLSGALAAAGAAKAQAEDTDASGASTNGSGNNNGNGSGEPH